MVNIQSQVCPLALTMTRTHCQSVNFSYPTRNEFLTLICHWDGLLCLGLVLGLAQAIQRETLLSTSRTYSSYFVVGMLQL